MDSIASCGSKSSLGEIRCSEAGIRQLGLWEFFGPLAQM